MCEQSVNEIYYLLQSIYDWQRQHDRVHNSLAQFTKSKLANVKSELCRHGSVQRRLANIRRQVE